MIGKIKATIHNFHHHSAYERFPYEDEAVNMVMTKPPCPMAKMSDEILGREDVSISDHINAGRGRDAFNAIHQLLDITWKECVRVLKPGGIICIHIGDVTRTISDEFKLYSNHSRIIYAFEQLGCDSLPSVILQKRNPSPTKFMGSGMLPSGAYVTLEHEWLLVFRKEGKRKFEKIEKDTRALSAMLWEERNVWYADQWKQVEESDIGVITKSKNSKEDNDAFIIARRAILMHSIYGDIVLDPFGGSSMISLAAIMSGRDSETLDQDEKSIKKRT